MVFAGFWHRFGAHVIDSVIVSLFTVLLLILLGVGVVVWSNVAKAEDTETPAAVTITTPAEATHPSPEKESESSIIPKIPGGGDSEDEEELVGLGIQLAYQLCCLVVGILYHTLFIASRWQATPGKRLVGVMVVTRDGKRLSRWHALARDLCCAVSWLTLGIGFMLAGWTREKTALHDMMCGTRVIRGEA